MDILYIGRFFTNNLLQNIQKNCRVGMSNHNFEMSIINGLCVQNEINLQCLTIPAVYSFPYNNRRMFTKAESYDYKRTHIRSIGFCNLPVLKEIWATISLMALIVKSAKCFNGDRIDVIINTPNNNLLNAVRLAKIFINKQITQTIIIPDIPSMVTAMDKQNPLKDLILKYRNKKSIKMASNSNGLVLLTEAMMDFINKPVPHIVMEGIVDVDSMDGDSVSSSKEIILYTGTLRKIFGVMNLVQAFQMINDYNVELWICGSGDSEVAINEAANRDSRIKFFGLVDSQTALKMQHQATILVNPRTSEGEYTKYSFPSKTMEYLLSGKSVIINRLSGIPDEYYNYVFVPTNETVSSLAACITQVIAMDPFERMTIARQGRDFIIHNKNSRIQTGRIIEMISKY